MYTSIMHQMPSLFNNKDGSKKLILKKKKKKFA